MWKDILIAIVTSASAFTALSWAAKALVTHLLSKDLEIYKIRLKAESDRELESLKNALQRTAFEHQVVFARLHEERAVAIRNLHSQMLDLFHAVEGAVTPSQGPEFYEKRVEQAKHAASLAVEFRGSFERQKLYLSQDLSDQISQFVIELYQFNLRFKLEMDLALSPDPQEKYGEEHEVWLKAWKSFVGRFKPFLSGLEAEFRLLLGSQSGSLAPSPAGHDK